MEFRATIRIPDDIPSPILHVADSLQRLVYQLNMGNTPLAVGTGDKILTLHLGLETGEWTVEENRVSIEQLVESIIEANCPTDVDDASDADGLEQAVADRVIDAEAIRTLLFLAIKEARA